MKSLLLAGAVMAAVGCQSEPSPAVRVPAPKTSTEPGRLLGTGSVDPAADMPEPATTTTGAPTTTTTVAAEPVYVPTTAHYHPPTTNPVYEPPSPQSQTVRSSSGGTWSELAECESGNANVDTGNGYSGYFQFSDATWQSMGTGYARAVDAPYSVQLAAAQRLQARSGWGQWPACSAKLGLL